MIFTTTHHHEAALTLLQQLLLTGSVTIPIAINAGRAIAAKAAKRKGKKK